MRVGVVTPRKSPTIGGGFAFHEMVLRALTTVETNHEFVLIDLNVTASRDWMASGLPLVDVRTMLPSPGPSAHDVPGTEAIARKLALDVVWYLDPGAEVLSVPVLATVLDLGHRQLPFFPELSRSGWDWESRENHYRRVLPRAARIFTGTHTGKEQIVRCYGVDPTSVVVNPFPAPKPREGDGPAQDDHVLARYALTPGYLFYPAQFWAHKNHANLLLALQCLEKEHNLAPDLVLTGSDQGNLAHVRAFANELGLEKRVKFLGFVPQSDLAALYRRATALVFPSFLGPDNLPPLEAFSFGCPVLASRIEGAEEQLGRKTAEFFDPARPDEMASAIARVLRNAAYRKRLTKRGKALVATRTPEAYVQLVLRTLDDFEPLRRNWPAEVMRVPSAIARFPGDLANPALLQTGFSDDGWLAGRSSLLLFAPHEASLLTVRGEVPYFCPEGFSTVLSVSIDGIERVQERSGTGPFEIEVKPSRGRGLHRIELVFSELQKLPDPDGRLVGAKLDFIGFTNEGALSETLE